MGSLFRSEEMTLCQLFLQSEASYACVSELGELGLVQFRDLNPDVNVFQRKFVNEVRRCEEMERKLRFLEKEIKKDEIPMLDTGENPDAPAPREMIDLEATFERLENEMREVNANTEALKRNYLELTELKHILRKTQSFFEEARQGFIVNSEGQSEGENMSEDTIELLTAHRSAAGISQQLGFLAEVINWERIPAFERMLWRACRGNVFLKQAHIDGALEDPVTGDRVNKSVFLIFFQGDQLKSRVKKICEGFRATLYPCPETAAERREMSIGVMTRIEDLNTVLSQTQDHRHRVLVGAARNVKVWFIKVRKIKAIYHTLNMFNLDVTQKCLISECWCPVADLDKIQLALRRGTEQSGSSVPSILNRMTTLEAPPTYHCTNKFTAVFQDFVDAYGVATYREVNPAPFTIITFPFLFSVMFGDAGHGVIMLLAALFMVLREKRIIAARGHKDELFGMFFAGRYIILLMGAFSIYSGLLYNDVFSKSLNIFGSAWNGKIYNNSDVHKTALFQLNPNTNSTEYSRNPYPFGMDPIWQISKNKITFLNSYKMKLSVILGISQMFFGVLLSFLNHKYFSKPINIFCEFIPQVLFMWSIFGYLVILIFYKWSAYRGEDAGCAPSLLIGLITMFLQNYPDLNAKQETYNCNLNPLYGGHTNVQHGVQIFLLIIAFSCIPWMLLLKPFLLRAQHMGKINFGGGRNLSVQSGDLINGGGHNEVGYQEETAAQPAAAAVSDSSGSHEFMFGEVLIGQAIHTIEYCLGCVSHTASYLRLWALSLAHAELSEVLWGMVLRIGLSTHGYGGAVVVFMLFTPWAVLTVGVLLLMEGLSAFLHTLRLHWVEFQSKFYQGEGYLFQPFSFNSIIELSEE